MRILFLGYWGLQDPLTTATIFPHLRLLQERDDVEAIRLVTVERGTDALAPPTLELPFASPKISYRALLSPPGGVVLITKTADFIRFPSQLIRHVKDFKADFILARGAPAGSLAYLVWRRTRLPFFVESFEPHAEYMRKAGIWSRFDPRYIFQQYWENQQKHYARGLLPVAENYRKQLLQEGVATQRVITVPCSVDLSRFTFRPAVRALTRQRLGYTDDLVVGVYVGKFGGIYYHQESFDLFRTVADFFGASFRLLILSPQPPAELRPYLTAVGLDSNRVTILCAPFADVPDYLSAADFGFGLHRPTPYVSPIKVGEYWASGLPVFLPDGVGDDSAIIEQERGGAIFEASQAVSIITALTTLSEIMQDPQHRATIGELAARYRSVERAREAYEALFSA